MLDGIFLAIGCDHPDAIVLRWIRARKWHLESAIDQFLSTIRWRCDWGMNELLHQGETLLPEDELRRGKTSFIGFDRLNRPINYVSVRDHVKGEYSLQSTERLTVLTMETGRKLLRSPCECVTVIFDMTQFALKNMDYQHLKFLIDLLENHYPESLGLALVVNAPWIFNSCWYLIKGWLDPGVEKKILFIKQLDELTEFIDRSVLPQHLQGTRQTIFEYIPPNQQDQLMFDTLRADISGHQRAKEQHRQASEHFLQMTRQWAQHDEDGDDRDRSFEEQRTEARRALTARFEELIPYIHTRTHYHRTGMIDEPIFQKTFNKIQQEKHSSI